MQVIVKVLETLVGRQGLYHMSGYPDNHDVAVAQASLDCMELERKRPCMKAEVVATCEDGDADDLVGWVD